MARSATIAIFILAMIATVVVVDILFFRHQAWERLIANTGIVLVYLAFYLGFLKNR